ncbi:MAG: hypothetical protein LQ340_004421 [Diploschistes diacapsis]|nr:MAG: hypothetical protein LQ340_004421 [Diploschistes diacapsis]
MSAGRELFKRRRQYANFGAAPGPLLPAIENPFASFKTTKVEITSELASHRPLDNSSTRSQMELQRVSHNRQYLSGNKGYEPYTVTIERGLMVPTRSAGAMNEDELELHNAVVASNRAAWAYTKCCVLFFVSLMITWIPSSLFRAYTLVHPMNSNFGIAYGAGFVLPLMGFWNTVIYVTISWDAVLDMFAGNIDGRVWKQWHGHWLGARKSQTEWKGCHGDSWVGRSRGLSLNSKEVWSQRIGEV